MKYFFLILLVLSGFQCKKINVCYLSLNRVNCESDALKLQGYYYTLSEEGYIKPEYFFYKNGVVLHLLNSNVTPDLLPQKEASWYSSDEIEKRNDCQLCWGVFIIHQNKISIEHWQPSDGFAFPTVRWDATITSDTTFRIDHYLGCDGMENEMGLQYYYKSMIQKPDSINNIIQ